MRARGAVCGETPSWSRCPQEPWARGCGRKPIICEFSGSCSAPCPKLRWKEKWPKPGFGQCRMTSSSPGAIEPTMYARGKKSKLQHVGTSVGDCQKLLPINLIICRPQMRVQGNLSGVRRQAFSRAPLTVPRIVSIQRGSTRRSGDTLFISVYQRKKRTNKRAAPAVLATALLTSLALTESPSAVVELSAPASSVVVVVVGIAAAVSV